MKHFASCLISTATCGLGLFGNAALADTAIVIRNSPSFEHQQLESGDVRVDVSYQADASAGQPNLSYQLFYRNTPKLQDRVYTRWTGSVDLLDLNGDGTPEVVVQTFSGGAHCCTNTKIYGWRQDRFQAIETGGLQFGGVFKDLDGNSKQEFVTRDNAFYYAFSAFAFSVAPDAIYAYENGQLVPVTRRYPLLLRNHLEQMYKSIRQAQANGTPVNGILAAYVAQKILLGEYEQGWAFMLTNYDRVPNRAFAGFKMQSNRDFPQSLRTFLIDRGYLDQRGRPTTISPSGIKPQQG